jgi:hypothetical protein
MYDNKDNDGLFQEMKESFAKQARINESEFENEAAEQRIQYEGFRPGLYLRIVVENVPSEFCQHLDPSYPIIIGCFSGLALLCFPTHFVIKEGCSATKKTSGLSTCESKNTAGFPVS